MAAISVIVPVYNVEPYLRRCVDSILEQTFTDFELILVDDGSPDNCPAICDEYAKTDSRIHVIHQENGGLSAARNAGIDLAFGNSDSQWLSFVDSDDWVHPQFLQFLYEAAINCNAGICVCCHKQTHEKITNTKLDVPIPSKLSFEEFYSLRNDSVNIITAWAKLYRKDYFQGIRYPIGRINEDIFTTHKLLTQSPRIAFVDCELYFYFINPDSIMRRNWTPDRLNEIQGYEELIQFTQEKNYPYAQIRAIKTYYWSLDRQIKQLQQSSNREFREYLRLLRKKLKKAIQQYQGVVPVSLQERHWLLEDIYPIRMWVYWQVKAISEKLGIKGN